MYNLNLDNDEKIEILDDTARVIINNKKALGVSIVITNKNIYLLDTPRDLDNMVLGNIINPPVMKEVIGKIRKDSLDWQNDTNLGSVYLIESKDSLEIISNTINDYLKYNN